MTSTDAAATAAVVRGLVMRPYAGESDLAEIVRLRNGEFAADDIEERWSLDDIAPVFRNPSEAFDPARDAFFAELDGRIVGYTRTDWSDATDGVREYLTRCAVDAALRRGGIGRTLLRHAIAHIREVAATHQTDRPKMLGAWSDDRNAGVVHLLRSEGYTEVRWFFEMHREGIDRDPPELPPLPEGLEVRPVTHADARQLWDADVEAFADHWGGFDQSDAAFRRWAESPSFQPEIAVVAYDGDEVGGGVINAIYADENAELGTRRGWLDSVYTRRRWRGRGLAKALIARSLHLLAERGMDTALLGVDADNPSGAFGLYESFGFATEHRNAAWRRPLGLEADR